MVAGGKQNRREKLHHKFTAIDRVYILTLCNATSLNLIILAHFGKHSLVLIYLVCFPRDEGTTSAKTLVMDLKRFFEQDT